MSLIGFDGVAATMKSDISPLRLRLHSGFGRVEGSSGLALDAGLKPVSPSKQ